MLKLFIMNFSQTFLLNEMIFVNTPYAFLYYTIMVSLMTNTYF